MKCLILAGAAALALSGCAPGLLAGLGGGIPAPVAVADRTVIDEQGMLALELAYKAARLALETAVDAGVIRGETATRIARLDDAAFAALGAARGAYRAGNAADYVIAQREAQASLTALLTLARK